MEEASTSFFSFQEKGVRDVRRRQGRGLRPEVVRNGHLPPDAAEPGVHRQGQDGRPGHESRGSGEVRHDRREGRHHDGVDQTFHRSFAGSASFSNQSFCFSYF